MNVLKSRFAQVAIVMFALLTLLFVRLFVLTVIQNESWSAEAASMSVKSVHTPAPRGEIFDRYGRMIAGNVQSFSLRFSTTDLTNGEANETAARVIQIMEKNGDRYYDNLPIRMEDGEFFYTYTRDIEEWLRSMDMPPGYTAQQAFDRLRETYDIHEGLDQYQAQTELQNVHRIYPPISVKNMVFSRDLDKQIFLGRYGLDTGLSAEEAFTALRVSLGIDEAVWEDGERKVIRSDISDAEAAKIMAVRNEVSAMGYMQYIPAVIASGISEATIVQIEEMSRSLPGVEIVSENKRVYPHGSTASHVIGYMGRISEQDIEKYQDPRYGPNDLVGLDGLEYSQESVLKGEFGVKYVQVNARGELVRVLDESEPVKGRDIYLTIDLDLQKTAEQALDQTLEKLQVGGVFESEYGNYRFSKASPNANVGAIVAIEVKTGEVLALANKPDFDLNNFVDGVSKEVWDSFQSKNPRDPLSPVPLYNVAARSAVAPGSTFKMVTATAALASGLDPELRLYDGGVVKIGNQPYGCLIWNTSGGSHGRVNLAEALKVSCNYYFFDIATGRNFAQGEKSLGYDEPISIDKIIDYAGRYGLGVPTGIEIGEAATSLPSSEGKMRQTKAALTNALNVRAEEYFEPAVVADGAKLKECISEIVSWAEENPSRGELAERMAETGVKEDMAYDAADLCKFSYFNFAKWTRGDELITAIGQGDNAYTPLQMANYIATIGNGGIRNKVSVISAIEGQQIEREPGVSVGITYETGLSEIIKGMKMVATEQGGSLRSVFGNFPAAVAAKTGTAERDGKIHPPDEVEYMKENLKRIAPALNWEDVEAEMTRLKQELPDIWRSDNTAVRQAVINLSGGKITYERMDAYKPDYKPFAWVIAMAPADDPKIAVAALIFQGDTSLNAAPAVREVIGKYLQLDKEYENFDLDSALN